MDILLAFAPFIVFVVLERLAGTTAGLIAGAITSFALLMRDFLTPKRSVKVLEIGTAILFGGLAAYARLAQPSWSIAAVRLRVDGGLLLIVLISILIGRPFTLTYARESTSPEIWNAPQFVRANYVITAVWAGAFVVLVLADIVLAYRPDLPPWIGIAATVLALYGAIRFTSIYSERQQTSSPTLVQGAKSDDAVKR